MQVLFFVLNKIEVLDDLMVELSNRGIKGATAIHSSGMATSLVGRQEDEIISGFLTALLDKSRGENRTIFMVLSEEKIQIAKEAIYSVVGDLGKPDTGILFSVPTVFVEGLVE